jgi:hypothetical protein
MAKSRLRLVTPSTVLRTVMPRKPPNRDLRTREHLTEAEVEWLMKATKDNRYGHRDATMILVAYRHGLRVSELVDRWTSERPHCTSVGSSRAVPAPIQSLATSYVLCDGSSGSRTPGHLSCSPRSVARRSRMPDLLGCSNGLEG